ncbi:Small GTPase rabd [Entamoeba marina]
MKFIMIGESSVGKTSCMNRYVNNSFSTGQIATVGVGISKKLIKVNNTDVSVEIWDTAGQERHATIVSNYFRGVVGAVIMYDVTNRDTFERVERWMETIRGDNNKKAVVLAGNKIDRSDRVVSKEEGEEKARQYGSFLPEQESNVINTVKEDEVVIHIGDEDEPKPRKGGCC